MSSNSVGAIHRANNICNNAYPSLFSRVSAVETHATYMPQPIPTTRLRQITNDACDSALSTTSTYSHEATASWNSTIINKILQSLISESTPSDASTESPRYKFAVNSTIIQHLSDPSTSTSTGTDAGTSTDAIKEFADKKEEQGTEVSAEGTTSSSIAPQSAAGSGKPKVGRRGMHSASGAYWNNEKDGMWSHKYEGGEGKGMDVVVSVMWIAV